MIVAGIGSRKGVSVAEVIAAVEAALEAHGLAVSALSALATTAFKREEEAIFAAGHALGLPVVVVEGGNSNGSFARPIPPSAIGDESNAALTTPSPLWGGIEGGGQQHSDRRQVDTPLRRPDSALLPPPSIPPHKGEGGVDAASDNPCDSRAPDRRNEGTLTHSELSQTLTGVPSVSEAAALAAAGEGARLYGPRIVAGPVTCALAISGDAA